VSRGIPENVIEEIRQHTDLVDVVGEYLSLERRGKNMVGLCPFHSEKTPSFTVSPEKQLFHCFGCAASGNVFSFIMQMDNLTFPEAAKFLAGRAGIKIPEQKSPSPAVDDLKARIYKLNNLAAKYFVYCLNNTSQGRKALEYLLNRGVEQTTIEQFMIGFAPAEWTGFYKFATKKGVSPDLLVKAGLASPGREKGHYDRFRNRIIFPIFDISGKVAGFGGRLLNGAEKQGPKYLNSPETPVFDKGSILYGMNLAREWIRREKVAIVMEGYTDVITAFQAGIKNVVASLGTSLTTNQARSLRSQASTVITAYDSDSAGEAATWRGLSILQSTGCLVQVAELPEGSDPDVFIRENGKEAFQEITGNACPLIEYRLMQLRKRYDLTSDRERRDYTDELMEVLQSTANYVEQNYYLKRAAEELGVDEDALRSELNKRGRRINRFREAGKMDIPENKQKINIKPAEKILLSLMLQSKEIARQGRSHLQLDFIEDELVRDIITTIFEHVDADKTVSAEEIINRFEDPQVASIITGAVTDPALQDLPPQTAKRMTEDCINKLYAIWAKQKQRELQKKLKELEQQGSEKQIQELLREHQHLLKGKESNPYQLKEGGDFNG